MKKPTVYILLFFVLLGMWLLLTMPVNLQELIAGIMVAASVLVLFRKNIATVTRSRLSIKAVPNALAFAAVFLLELFKSNIDVALRVLNPKLPIRPGIVKVATTLHSPLGRIVLANAITLTPGTLTVETEGEHFYIHWIDVSAGDVEAASSAIVRKFERYLEVMFG
ncbi:MAG: Na+/H+ antiporter subunit E [Chitinispirillaceae bacterium]|nr:Na+/H+ antiporter subunit E [Chitinispirillaceae bacterium]